MIEYFEQLTQEEQEDLTDVIRLLYRQTFLLEMKFDKRAGRLQYQREYRICEKHIDFLKMYFQIAGITLCENVHRRDSRFPQYLHRCSCAAHALKEPALHQSSALRP